METSPDGMRYVGFWARVLASMVDTVLMLMVIAPVAWLIVGPEYFNPMRGTTSASVLLEWAFPAIAVVVFWIYRSATPGKMAIGAVIVDANTGQKPSTGQFIGRYFGYFVSILPLFLGLLWVGWDPRKQGFHDKLAGTVVVRKAA